MSRQIWEDLNDDVEKYENIQRKLSHRVKVAVSLFVDIPLLTVSSRDSVEKILC